MPSLLRHGWSLVRAPANEVGFALRSTLRWRRGRPVPQSSGAPSLFSWLPAEQRAAAWSRAERLTQHYELAALREAVTPAVFARNLARLEGLERLVGDRAMPRGPDGVVRAVDVGCGDFHYAVALQRWLARDRAVVLRGIEMDGHGVYRDGHSRADHATWFAEQAEQDGQSPSRVSFEVADAATMQLPEQDLATVFFPFLSAYACLSWGAPLSRLRPRRLLRRVVQALRPGGWLIVTNQTAAEHLRLGRLLRELPVTRVARCRFASDLVPESAQTSGQLASLWQRHGDVPVGKPVG